MDSIIYNSLVKYFNTLANTGYVSYDRVYKILYIILIQRFMDDFSSFLAIDDIDVLKQSVEKLYGTDCLVPFPDMC